MKNYDAIVDLNTNFCAASSILFLLLEALLDPIEGLVVLSEFNLEDDA